MSRVPLTGGAYTARSLIAGAQRCLNLYPEAVPQIEGEPVPVVHYPTPGLRQISTPPTSGAGRGIYRASNGAVFAVVAKGVYAISSAGAWSHLGDIAAGTTPVSMADNGNTVLLVDGTAQGYTIDLATLEFAAVNAAAFYGADRVEYLDTFFVLNKPGAPQFYISGSLEITFDPLDFANKSVGADSVVAVAVVRGEIWLLGELTSEVWYNSGAADFTFQRIPAGQIEHGCAAKYSVARQDNAVFWLSQDRAGAGIVLRGSGMQAERVSTHAIEAEWAGYATISDAVGWCYQQGGHAFYVLSFPSADKTWALDMATGLWHERAWIDGNGAEHRHRASCHAWALGENLVLDWQTGALYALDPNVLDDAGKPIKRLRSFPHMVKDGKRVFYRQFLADMEVGTAPATMLGSGEPQVFLRWSDTRGASWGNPITASLGGSGEYLTSIQYQRLGMARDRVFELSWSAPVKTALLGAFVDASLSGS